MEDITLDLIFGKNKENKISNNNHSDEYVEAIDEFIGWAYDNGIDFSYMGSGKKDGRWFCENIKYKFLHKNNIYFIKFSRPLSDIEITSIRNDKRLEELIVNRTLDVEFGFNEDITNIDPKLVCCTINSIKKDGCEVTINDKTEYGLILKNYLDNKSYEVTISKNIMHIEETNKTKILKFYISNIKDKEESHG